MTDALRVSAYVHQPVVSDFMDMLRHLLNCIFIITLVIIIIINVVALCIICFVLP